MRLHQTRFSSIISVVQTRNPFMILRPTLTHEANIDQMWGISLQLV